MTETFEQRGPILDAVALHAQQADVGGRTEQTLLQVLPKPVVDSKRDDQRSYTRRYPQDGDRGDHADERLPALGAKITSCNEEFEAHQRQPSAISHQPKRIIDGKTPRVTLRLVRGLQKGQCV